MNTWLLTLGALLIAGCAGDDGAAYRPRAGGCPSLGQTSDDAPDFGIGVRLPAPTDEHPVSASFEGEVTVGDEEKTALVLSAEDGTQGLFAGKHPELAKGTTLWASLSQSSSKTSSGTHAEHLNWVKAGEDGPMLAEDQLTQLPESAAMSTTFLGVTASFEAMCQELDPCFTLTRYRATIHGDDDLVLTSATRGRLAVDGVQYEVWLDTAETIERSKMAVCKSPNDAPAAEIALLGRAADYAALLK